MTMAKTCTCAGTAPGFPQHEYSCGRPELTDAELDMEEWFEAVMTEEPARTTAEDEWAAVLFGIDDKA